MSDFLTRIDNLPGDIFIGIMFFRSGVARYRRIRPCVRRLKSQEAGAEVKNHDPYINRYMMAGGLRCADSFPVNEKPILNIKSNSSEIRVQVVFSAINRMRGHLLFGHVVSRLGSYSGGKV